MNEKRVGTGREPASGRTGTGGEGGSSERRAVFLNHRIFLAIFLCVFVGSRRSKSASLPSPGLNRTRDQGLDKHRRVLAQKLWGSRGTCRVFRLQIVRAPTCKFIWGHGPNVQFMNRNPPSHKHAGPPVKSLAGSMCSNENTLGHALASCLVLQNFLAATGL